ncbi:hypothetical protein M0805_000265 [Coniferiporia weirii]|nr:hypothetical protein M0805_000265 [Coniferiporia weirii]
MRFSVALLFVGVASASAALITRQAGVPTCALTCIENADFGGCSSTDDTCLCNNAAFVNSTTVCIESTCTGSDLAAAEQFAQANCEAVGVTLSAPSSTASSSASGSSPTESGSGSSSPSATSPSSGSSTGTSASAASSQTSSSSGARATGAPILAVAALGLAAFAF